MRIGRQPFGSSFRSRPWRRYVKTSERKLMKTVKSETLLLNNLVDCGCCLRLCCNVHARVCECDCLLQWVRPTNRNSFETKKPNGKKPHKSFSFCANVFIHSFLFHIQARPSASRQRPRDSWFNFQEARKKNQPNAAFIVPFSLSPPQVVAHLN